MENKGPQFLLAQKLEDFLEKRYTRPFLHAGWNEKIFRFIVINLLHAFEKMIPGKPVFIKHEESPLDRIPARFHGLVFDLRREKVIKKIFFPPVAPDWPKVFAYGIMLENGQDAYGCELEPESAATKAFAEAIERHSLTAGVREEKCITGTWKELRSRGAVNPRVFFCFSEKQLSEYRHARYRFNDDSVFNWTRAVSLVTGKKHLIPAQLLQIRYKFLSNEPVIRHANGSGMAAGSTREMALTNALYEAVERDAFFIHWLNKITPNQIDLATCQNQNTKEIAALYKKFSIDVAVFDITTDIGIPVFLTAIRNQGSDGPVIWMSCKANFDKEYAIAASLQESLSWGSYSPVTRDKVKIELKNEAPRSRSERKMYWYNRNLIPHFQFLYQGKLKRMDSGGSEKKLSDIIHVFKKIGYEIFAADLTTGAARKAGLEVWATIVPELYPLFLNEDYKYLGVRRLYEGPVRMGVFTKPQKEEDMNPVPHPFL